MDDASGALPTDLFEAGDPSFVDAIRAVRDFDALAEFADRWSEDRRPASRRLLFDYLDRPLNAFRHEGLIKRLFKKAEAAGDDPLMARFLVLFDRSVRRTRARPGTGPGVERPRGGSTMPRGAKVEVRRRGGGESVRLPDWAARFGLGPVDVPEGADIGDHPAVLAKLGPLRLFRPRTRNYLRRRAWRYFRRLERTHPGRYVGAVSEALALYRDEDMEDERALLDNWGLVHILFHHCPVLEARPAGWAVRPGRSTEELGPAPIFERLWDQAPAAAVGLLSTARSRAVRRWAGLRVEADPAHHRGVLGPDGWAGLLGHDDPDVVSLAAGMLDDAGGVAAIGSTGVGAWLGLAESTPPSALGAVCDLIGRHVTADRVTVEQAARLAGLRAEPAARLGLSWLVRKAVESPAEIGAALKLVDAGCAEVRPEILRWIRQALGGSTGFDPSMLLVMLDSRHADARLEGLAWFGSDPRATDDVGLWRALAGSPRDEIRAALVAELEARPARAGFVAPEALRALWAGALMGVARGGRAKPGVVRQVLRRLETSPGEAPALLPLLGLALRSARAPERRAGLVALVRLAGQGAEVAPLVRSSFPELQFP